VVDCLDDHARLCLCALACSSPTGDAAWSCFSAAAGAYGLPRQLLCATPALGSRSSSKASSCTSTTEKSSYAHLRPTRVGAINGARGRANGGPSPERLSECRRSPRYAVSLISPVRTRDVRATLWLRATRSDSRSS
jgi:hypothetical protein